MSDEAAKPDEPKDLKLTLRERAFVSALLKNGYRIGAAYMTAAPGTRRERAQDLGSKMLKNIKSKTGEWQRILELAGLDDMRLAFDLNRLLRAKKLKFYKGLPVSTKEGKPMILEDNGSQMNALELLADLLGRRKMVVPVDDKGRLLSGVLMVPAKPTSEDEWEGQGVGASGKPSKP